jgi:hypothetical protein
MQRLGTKSKVGGMEREHNNTINLDWLGRWCWGGQVNGLLCSTKEYDLDSVVRRNF